jgi:hypothetical protein
MQAVWLWGWCLVCSETRSQTRQHRCSGQGCAPASPHSGDRDVAEWRAPRSGRPRPPSPQHRHDRLLRQGGCRAAQTGRSDVAGGEWDDCGCRNLSCRAPCRRVHSQQHRIPLTQLCGLRDCSKAKAHPYSHSHRTGPPKRDRSRNGTRAIRSSVTLLSTFAWKISSTNCPRRTTSGLALNLELMGTIENAAISELLGQRRISRFLVRRKGDLAGK